MIVKLTATKLPNTASPQEITQKLVQILRTMTGRGVRVKVNTRDDLTGIDITRILQNRT